MEVTKDKEREMEVTEDKEREVETFAMMFGKEYGVRDLVDVVTASTTGTEHSNG